MPLGQRSGGEEDDLVLVDFLDAGVKTEVIDLGSIGKGQRIIGVADAGGGDLQAWVPPHQRLTKLIGAQLQQTGSGEGVPAEGGHGTIRHLVVAGGGGGGGGGEAAFLQVRGDLRQAVLPIPVGIGDGHQCGLPRAEWPYRLTQRGGLVLTAADAQTQQKGEENREGDAQGPVRGDACSRAILAPLSSWQVH